jgi:hypothetical protein
VLAKIKLQNGSFLSWYSGAAKLTEDEASTWYVPVQRWHEWNDQPQQTKLAILSAANELPDNMSDEPVGSGKLRLYASDIDAALVEWQSCDERCTRLGPLLSVADSALLKSVLAEVGYLDPGAINRGRRKGGLSANHFAGTLASYSPR